MKLSLRHGAREVTLEVTNVYNTDDYKTRIVVRVYLFTSIAFNCSQTLIEKS